MLSSRFSAALTLCAIFSLTLRADTITLSDGRTIEGDVLDENATEIVVKTKVGKTTIKREEIQSIDKKKTDASQLREKMDDLAKSSSKGDVAAWLKLAEAAKAKNERGEAQRAYEEILKLDSNNETARNELGYVKSGTKWVAKADMKDSGTKTPFEMSKNAQATSGMTREKMAAAAGVASFAPEGEKAVNCPRCKGTGIFIVLPCLNCKKSDKPGYKMMGDHYEMDQRCGGTGKTIGAYCELCKRTGKVMLSHLNPTDGGNRKPNSGMMWCPNCHGTGYEKFLACNQCKRSKWPGYNFLGDQVVLCTSCNGAAKKPALDCDVCRKTGQVPITKGDPDKQYGINVESDNNKKK